MSSRSDVVTPDLLREWPLPEPGDSKYARGKVVVVGGAARTPGAALLAGLAVLRVGAGHLSLGVAESVAAQVAVALPESGVVGLPETGGGSVRGDAADALKDTVQAADAILVGPGLDDIDETAALLRGLVPQLNQSARVVLDAYALGALTTAADVCEPLVRRLVLTPNQEEAARLLNVERVDDFDDAALAIARRYQAVVSCQNAVADPDGNLWRIGTGHAGLATSGSGDVLAGAVTGLTARGATPEQAACWGNHLHAVAGDRLAARLGPVGFLARELLDEMPRVLAEVGT